MKFLLIGLLLLSTSAMSGTKVKMETTHGDIFIELEDKKAPISTQNFLSYVDSGFYNGLIFHRVIGNFMIQGGGFNQGMNQKTPNAPIKNEATNGISNAVGTIAMARTGVVDSATSQFFINVVDNSRLDYQGPSNYGYAVFGRVYKGMTSVNKIKMVPTGNTGGYQNVPQTPVVINKVTRVK